MVLIEAYLISRYVKKKQGSKVTVKSKPSKSYSMKGKGPIGWRGW